MNIEAESGDAFEIPDLWKPSSLISSSSDSLLFSRLGIDAFRDTTLRELSTASSLATRKDRDAFKLLGVHGVRNHDIGGFFASPFAEEKSVEEPATPSAPDIPLESQTEHIEDDDPWQSASVIKPDNTLQFHSWDTFDSQLKREQNPYISEAQPSLLDAAFVTYKDDLGLAQESGKIVPANTLISVC
jgi:hypothetical protein